MYWFTYFQNAEEEKDGSYIKSMSNYLETIIGHTNWQQ
jgi:hypothetical protein